MNIFLPRDIKYQVVQAGGQIMHYNQGTPSVCPTYSVRQRCKQSSGIYIFICIFHCIRHIIFQYLILGFLHLLPQALVSANFRDVGKAVVFTE